MGRHLILVGGGHAHLGVIRQGARFVRQGHRFTVISPKFHDYSGMGPGLLSGQYPVGAARFDVEALTIAAGGQFVEDTVSAVDPEGRMVTLASGECLPYDVLSFNTGSSIEPLPMDKPSARKVYSVKPIANLLKVRDDILKRKATEGQLRLLVVGGGPAGCEVAGNLQALAQQLDLDLDITLIAGRALLHSFSSRTRKLVLEELMRLPMHLVEGCHVESLQAGKAILSDRREIPFDLLVQATGIKPAGPFKESGLAVGPHGGLSVNSSLHTSRHPEVFAGGDCLYFQPGILQKVGVYAVRQSPVLAKNLLAALESQPMQPFSPQKEYLLVFNLGLDRAVATGYGFSWRGRSASFLKNYLDTRFVSGFHRR